MGKLIIKIGEKVLMLENYLKSRWNAFVSLLMFKSIK